MKRKSNNTFTFGGFLLASLVIVATLGGLWVLVTFSLGLIKSIKESREMPPESLMGMARVEIKRPDTRKEATTIFNVVYWPKDAPLDSEGNILFCSVFDTSKLSSPEFGLVKSKTDSNEPETEVWIRRPEPEKGKR